MPREGSRATRRSSSKSRALLAGTVADGVTGAPLVSVELELLRDGDGATGLWRPPGATPLTPAIQVPESRCSIDSMRTE